MDRAQLIALFDRDQRIDIVYPDMRREATANVVRHIDTAADGEGMVIYSQLDDSNADAEIRAQVRFFESLGQDFEWKLYDYDRPPDLKERLADYGFVVQEAEAIMVLDLTEAPGSFWQPVRHEVQRITDPEEISALMRVEEQVWAEDFTALGDYLRSALHNYPQQMSVYAAYVDGGPVSAAWIYFSPRSQFASLWGGATLRGFRQRGLYTALLATRAQEAKARGVRYLTVDASPMSRPILEKHGFEMIALSYACKWKCRGEGQV